MNPVTVWWLAIRPKTLSLSITPVIAGNCLAWADRGALLWGVALATLVAAMAIQIGTNLFNDVVDHERGADGSDRIGPRRATAEGWLSAAEVKRGAALAFGGAGLIGIYLASVGGWPILLLGLGSIAAGYGYTGGSRPIAYSASGELFVFLFFGLFAVTGSYFLQTGECSFTALAGGAALGAMAAAVLLVNNYRDLDTDRQAHKLTLCHRLERPRSRPLYAALMLIPFGLPLSDPGQLWPALLVLPVALLLSLRFFRAAPGAGLNRLLAHTAQAQLAFGLLLGVGFIT